MRNFGDPISEKLFSALLVILLIGSLSGCMTRSQASGGDTVNLGGNIANWTLGEAEVVAELAAPEELTEIARGTVTKEGGLTLKLPLSVPEASLTLLAEALPCNAFSLSPEGPVHRVVLGALSIWQEGSKLGSVAQASSQAATFPFPEVEGDVRVFRWYSERAVTVEGSCEQASFGKTFTLSWQLELAEGWNIVVEKVEKLSEDGVILSTRTSDLPEGLRWHFLDAAPTPASSQ